MSSSSSGYLDSRIVYLVCGTSSKHTLLFVCLV